MLIVLCVVGLAIMAFSMGGADTPATAEASGSAAAQGDKPRYGSPIPTRVGPAGSGKSDHPWDNREQSPVASQRTGAANKQPSGVSPGAAVRGSDERGGGSGTATAASAAAVAAAGAATSSSEGEELAPLPGLATPEGTAKYRTYMHDQTLSPPDDAHFHTTLGSELVVSSIGIGTYRGDPTSETDHQVTMAVAESIRRGINVIDSAVNYRMQRGERSVGKALRRIVDDPSTSITRDHIIISTKGGFIPGDPDKRKQNKNAVAAEWAAMVADADPDAPSDSVVNSNCMHPACLERSLTLSLDNLAVSAVDVYFLHNVAETHLRSLDIDDFMDRLADAFEYLEQQRAAGTIGAYGLATWTCFRTEPGQQGSLDLGEVVRVAQEVGGPDHGFRWVQLPINTGMLEAADMPWHTAPGDLQPSARGRGRVLGTGGGKAARLRGGAAPRRTADDTTSFAVEGGSDASPATTERGGERGTDPLTAPLPSDVASTSSATTSAGTVTSTTARGDVGEAMPLLQAAELLGINVMASNSLGKGPSDASMSYLRHAAENVGWGDEVPDAGILLQFTRSVPTLMTALVGMKSPQHVAEDTMVVQRPPLSDSDWRLTAEELLDL